MSEEREHFRWFVTATYRAENEPITIDSHIEEIAELHALIEHGSHWNALEEIVIRLNRVAPHTPTTQLSERPSDDRPSISPPFSKASRFGCPGLRRGGEQGVRRRPGQLPKPDLFAYPPMRGRRDMNDIAKDRGPRGPLNEQCQDLGPCRARLVRAVRGLFHSGPCTRETGESSSLRNDENGRICPLRSEIAPMTEGGGTGGVGPAGAGAAGEPA
jgi:hypothetical protein